MNQPPVIAGIGEALWDCFPDGRQLGGAPANFAFHAAQLGACAYIVSRVGTDAAGARLTSALARTGLASDHIQRDGSNPTGTVQIRICRGEPDYEISTPAAWDFIEWTESLAGLASRIDAIAFGTLAQREQVSRETIRKFVQRAPKTALKFFDINLRKAFYTANSVEFGLAHATVVKLNQDELAAVSRLCGLPADPKSLATTLERRFGVSGLVLTLGARGCACFFGGKEVNSMAPATECRDTVGAGDAFAAAFVTGLLRGDSLQRVADYANRVGAFVVSQTGAMPYLPPELSPVPAL